MIKANSILLELLDFWTKYNPQNEQKAGTWGEDKNIGFYLLLARFSN